MCDGANEMQGYNIDEIPVRKNILGVLGLQEKENQEESNEIMEEECSEMFKEGDYRHPSLEMVVSTRVRVHGSGQHFPQFDSKASRPLPVASDFEWPFLRKIAKLWLLSSFLN